MIGQRVRRLEDPPFLTGQGQYVDDLPIEGALHATFVRSPWAHARIRRVDKSAAISRPGVQVFTAVNPLGAKGIGESGTIGATPAVHSAVIDALAHLGVRDIDMPANGERVWRAIQEARGGR